MKLQSLLDELQADTPGCSLTAFGDLSAKLVLRSCETSKVKREHLDQLCNAAESSFGIVENIQGYDVADCTQSHQVSILFSATESEVFARTANEPNEFTCAILGPGQSLDTAMRNTVACSDKIKEATE